MRTVTIKKETDSYTLDTKNEDYLFQNKARCQADAPIFIDLAGITRPYGNYYLSRKEACYAAKNLYVVEYIKSGIGYIEVKGQGTAKKVQAGDLYIINKGYAVTYYADKDCPYEKLWFNIGGKCLRNLMDTFSITTPVFICHMQKKEIENLFQETLTMLDSELEMSVKNYNMISFFTKLFIEIDKSSNNSNNNTNMFEKITNYIDSHIFLNIDIKDIADCFFISRCSLYRIFIKNCGVSPKQYVLDKKIEKAKAILVCEKHTTAEIADMLGFCDKYHFCHIFKQITGKSPAEYRAHNGK